MSYDPRTIAFLAEVLYPPTQIEPSVVQGIHNTLFVQPELGYQSWQERRWMDVPELEI